MISLDCSPLGSGASGLVYLIDSYMTMNKRLFLFVIKAFSIILDLIMAHFYILLTESLTINLGLSTIPISSCSDGFSICSSNR